MEGKPSASGSSHEYACVSGSRKVVLCVRSKHFRRTLERFAPFPSSWDFWMHRDNRVISLDAPAEPGQSNPMLVQKQASQVVSLV